MEHFFLARGGHFFQKVVIFTKKREKNVFIFKMIKNDPNNPKFYQNELLAIGRVRERKQVTGASPKMPDLEKVE